MSPQCWGDAKGQKNQTTMKTIILSISLMILSVALSTVNAQTEEQKEEVNEQILELRLDKDDVEIEEREALKVEVEVINQKLQEGKITATEAEKLKEEAAERRAKNIENRTAIIDNKIDLLERNGTLEFNEAKGANTVTLNIGEGEFFKLDTEKRRKKYDRRTVSDLVLAAGFNNALSEGQSISDSDYKLAGSRFFEIGWAWKTRVFKESNWLRVKYGFSFQFNGLKPTDNRYFVKDVNDQIVLVEHPESLDKSKFRMDNLVFPVHFEFGPSKRVEKDETLRFSTEDKLKIGLGGYAGFGLGARQKLKYETEGRDVKEKLKGDYNTNDFIYGLSGYVGLGGAAVYAKYDLNPIFDNAAVDQHNFSLGLRFDID